MILSVFFHFFVVYFKYYRRYRHHHWSFNNIRWTNLSLHPYSDQLNAWLFCVCRFLVFFSFLLRNHFNPWEVILLCCYSCSLYSFKKKKNKKKLQEIDREFFFHNSCLWLWWWCWWWCYNACTARGWCGTCQWIGTSCGQRWTNLMWWRRYYWLSM